ncbi:MAG: DUF1566 domain-containing protein [Leptospiraceae bacterium]|nr:DUF1566 domain-containing protein [Leptospiraceae bacterium]
MKKIITFLFLISNLFNCKQNENSNDPLLLLGYRVSRITLTGQAIKGEVKNGLVKVTSINSDGSCSSNLLGIGYTDSSGNYSIDYSKTGSSVCVTVGPRTEGTTLLYDEKSKKDLSVSSNSTFSLVNVVREDSITGNKKSSIFISPLTKILSQRMQTLAKENPGTSSSILARRAGKEIVIRFGLSSALSSKSFNKNISDSNYPDFDDLNSLMGSSTTDVGKKFYSFLAGFAQMAQDNKTGTDVSSDDVENVIAAFAKDMSNGKFDGVDSSGVSVTIGNTGKALGANSLTNQLLPAVKKFISEGGTIGSASSGAISVTTTELNNISFIETTEITSTLVTPAATNQVIISPAGGHYLAGTNVSLSSSAGASIYYTTDGTTPTSSSTLYSSSIPVYNLAGKTIQAIAYTSGIPAAVYSATYSMTLPKTGQALCFQADGTGITCAGTGQDGQFQAGYVRSFTDNGNNTINDNNTGLIWQKCSYGQTADASCTNAASTAVWDDAVNYCSTLTLAGLTWRLPSNKELLTIHELEFSPTTKINTTIFPNPGLTTNYWTSSVNSAGTYVVDLDFRDGAGSGFYDKTNAYHVKCVSGYNRNDYQSFTDNSDGTIKDNVTGLVWQKCTNGQSYSSGTCTAGGTTMTYDTALSTCNSLSLAGRTWRLPNRMELHSILIHNGASLPLINQTIFPNTNSAGYFSSTNSSANGVRTGAYVTEFSNMTNLYQPKSNTYYSKCVSGP